MINQEERIGFDYFSHISGWDTVSPLSGFSISSGILGHDCRLLNFHSLCFKCFFGSNNKFVRDYAVGSPLRMSSLDSELN